MPVAPVTRRRLLLSSALVCGLAGCSGAPGESTDVDSAGQGTDDAGDAGGTAPETTGPADSPTDESPESVTSTDASARTTSAPDTASPAPDEPTPTTDEDPDLREANVVGVEFTRSGSSYRFAVTLYHDDDGESGYADWWQVETLTGERLGRRTLLHAHSTAPFTRSETITIPEGTRYVVVRGHDQTHGYGGQAMVVNVETGETEAVRQGPEPRDFSDYEPSV